MIFPANHLTGAKHPSILNSTLDKDTDKTKHNQEQHRTRKQPQKKSTDVCTMVTSSRTAARAHDYRQTNTTKERKNKHNGLRKHWSQEAVIIQNHYSVPNATAATD